MEKFHFKALILFSAFITIVCCNETQKNNIKTLRTVVLSASKNDTLMNTVLLDDSNNEFNTPPFLSASKDKQNKLVFSFPLNHPKLFQINGFDIATPSSIVYVSPGDSLTFFLNENKQIVFEGKNEAHYNFFNKLFNAGIKYPLVKDEVKVEYYEKQSVDAYQRKLDFLKRYVKQETVSPQFNNKVNTVLQYEFIWYLMKPQDITINLTKHIDTLSINSFNNEQMLDSYFFRNALMDYLSLLPEIRNSKDQKTKFTNQIDKVNKHLNGNVKQYALTKTFINYSKGLTPELIEPLKSYISEYEPLISNKIYNNEIKHILDGLDKLNVPLSEDVLNIKVQNLQGKTFSLREILKQHNDSIKVIDFWASWCVPCIKSIKESNNFRNGLKAENHVSWIFISVDQEAEKWRKKAYELKDFGTDKNQYLIEESPKKIIADYFNITGIPHYSLLDRDNLIIMLKTPSPTNKATFKQIIQEVDKK